MIDNKAEKYSSSTPYAYALNNPILFLDPDGNDILIYYKEQGKNMTYRYTGGNVNNSNPFVQKVAAAWNYNVSNGGGDPSFEAATNSDITVNVVETDGRNAHKDGFVYWNPERGLLTDEGVVLSPATGLDHELDHGVEYNKTSGKIDKTSDEQYGNTEEKRVITGYEQKNS